mmetsp:Transcript_63883/g.176428  ORF Transcript_63883/g.176428 Transcript_63883/m.176428 type:complete len:253 (+) Transcript_63883:2115-2873(+)
MSLWTLWSPAAPPERASRHACTSSTALHLQIMRSSRGIWWAERSLAKMLFTERIAALSATSSWLALHGPCNASTRVSTHFEMSPTSCRPSVSRFSFTEQMTPSRSMQSISTFVEAVAVWGCTRTRFWTSLLCPSHTAPRNESMSSVSPMPSSRLPFGGVYPVFAFSARRTSSILLVLAMRPWITPSSFDPFCELMYLATDACVTLLPPTCSSMASSMARCTNGLIFESGSSLAIVSSTISITPYPSRAAWHL